MYKLFNLREFGEFNVIYPTGWNSVKLTLQRNLGTVIKYYRKSPMAVPSQHFLIRLLQTIAVPQSLNTLRYYDNVCAMAMDHSMAMKMTSSIYQGKVFDGVFYGTGNKEILIAIDDSFDPELATREWQNLQPVKVIRHPRSDLKLNLPDGNNTGIENGIVVVTINIPMLAIQYRAFRLEETRIAEITNDSQRSIQQFIHMYVLPNMLYSHFDYALFNRIRNLLIGAPLGESLKEHPFYISDYSKQLNDIDFLILNHLKNNKQGFTGLLRNIPALTKKDMDQVLDLPKIAPTRQVIWALLISRLPVLDFMLDASKEYGISHNQQEINNLLRTILSFRSNNILKNVLNGDLYYDVNLEINEVVQKTKYRK